MRLNSLGLGTPVIHERLFSVATTTSADSAAHRDALDSVGGDTKALGWLIPNQGTVYTTVGCWFDSNPDEE